MQPKLDTNPNNFGPRLRAFVEGRGTIEQAYEKIGVSRATLFNWFDRDRPPPGKTKLDKLRRYLGNEAHWILDGTTDSTHLKSGARRVPPLEDPAASFGAVASRLPQRREPSTRADCEDYFANLIARADLSANPNAWPVIHERLIREFPLDEWPPAEPENETP